MKNVVIRESQKMVSVVLIPLSDHLGIIITVAPEGMSVEIAAPPPGFGRRGLVSRGQGCEEKNGCEDQTCRRIGISTLWY